MFLDIEFDKNPVWSKSKMHELAVHLGLKDSQIYKWHWDRSQTVHKRFQKTLRKINTVTKKVMTNYASEDSAHSLVYEEPSMDIVDQIIANNNIKTEIK